MRHKSGRLRDNIRKFIDDFFAENGRAPSSWEAIFGSGELFLVKADRDEPEFGIDAGDYVAAERRKSAAEGEIVVAERGGKLCVERVNKGSEDAEVRGVVCRIVKKVDGII